MIKYIVPYSLLFALLAALLLMQIPKRVSSYRPFEGIIYSVSSSSASNVVEKTLYASAVSHSDSSLPELNVYCDFSLPKRFIANLSDSTSDYVIITSHYFHSLRSGISRPAAPASSATVAATPKKETKKPVPTKPATPASSATTTPARPVAAVLNVSIIQNILSSSYKSYFFSGKSLSLNDVTVNIVSITPWNDKYILKFSVVNSQTSYFFVSNLALYDKKVYLSADFYNDTIIPPGKTIFGFAVFSTALRELTFKALENSTTARSFDITFNIP